MEKPVSKYKILLFGILLLLNPFAKAQSINKGKILDLDYRYPKEYTIGGISVTGNKNTDRNLVLLYSGLYQGQKIKVPGEELRKAVERIWQKDYFSDIEIRIERIEKEVIFLNIFLVERPKLSSWQIKGLSKTKAKAVNDELSLSKFMIVNENLLNRTKKDIFDYFYEKGYADAQVNIDVIDTAIDYQSFIININRGKKTRMYEYVFEGNDSLDDKKLRKVLSPKWKKNNKNIFASAKFLKSEYEASKAQVIRLYNSQGFRDAAIVSDTIIHITEGWVKAKIKIKEGTKYFYRSINFVGNSKYSSGLLDTILGIKKGDVYDLATLEKNLYLNPEGIDISGLYMNDGYLFFNVTPVETAVQNDSIDLEIRIYEGKQATINTISIAGNDKTSDHVILRVLRTRPGDKFSRSAIQRSIRELAQLNYFDAEKLDVVPTPNPASGTVDILYKVEEKSTDQIEASGGYGGFQGGLVGTLGLSLNNFSTRRMFGKDKNWDPVPSGDGQRLTLRAQSNGPRFQSYNMSFTEPWLGGKKPNSFTFSVFHSRQTNSFGAGAIGSFNANTDNFLQTTGISFSLGKLLKFPDDYFTLLTDLNFQRYQARNFLFAQIDPNAADKLINSLSFAPRITLARNSTSDPIFPTEGSEFRVSLQGTPPFSLVNNKNYKDISIEERYRFIEYYKLKIDAKWFSSPFGKFVLTPQFRLGMVGIYNDDLGYSPFELFRVGGSGLTGFTLYGTDIVSQRGYSDGSLSSNHGAGSAAFTKYSLELRYPLSNNPNARAYIHTFLEAGNAWNSLNNYNPFELKRAFGGGVRLFMPMFGLLGLDYGVGIDNQGVGIKGKGQFHFFLGQQF